MKVRVGDQITEIDPASDPMGYTQLLEDRYDENIRRQRAKDDEQRFLRPNLYAGGDPTFSRMQQDAAMGRGGFNRQWVPFFESFDQIGENTGKAQRLNVGSMHLPWSARMQPLSLQGLTGSAGQAPISATAQNVQPTPRLRNASVTRNTRAVAPPPEPLPLDEIPRPALQSRNTLPSGSLMSLRQLAYGGY